MLIFYGGNWNIRGGMSGGRLCGGANVRELGKFCGGGVIFRGRCGGNLKKLSGVGLRRSMIVSQVQNLAYRC